MAMFYFIKGLSVFRIVTEPCPDHLSLSGWYLYMSYIIHSHTKQTGTLGSDVRAVCHVGHTHLCISESRWTTAINFQIAETGILCYLCMTVSDPIFLYSEHEQDW